MSPTDNQDKADLCEQLARAGVSDLQLHLALETSGALLEQLAATPLDERHKRSVREIFDHFARSKEMS